MNRLRQVLLLAISLSLTVAVSGFFGQSPSQASPPQKKRTGPVASRGTDAPSVESLDFLPRPFTKSTPEQYRLRMQLEAAADEDARLNPRPLPPAPIFAVIADPEAEGAERDRQSQAATLISRQAELAQYVPEARRRHFAWVERESNYHIRGWKGTILKTWTVKEGLGVRVRVSPVIDSGLHNSYNTEETYLVSQGVVTPMGIELSNPDAPHVISFP